MATLGSPEPQPETGVTVHRLRPAMGTWLSIGATAETQRAALAGIEAAWLAITEVVQRLHPAGAGSEIARLISAPVRMVVPISSTTWELLALAQSIHTLSQGVFDPCLPSRPGRLSDLRLSPTDAQRPWALCHLPVALDLGGIAKGFAIDRATDALRASGCSSALVNAGGDLRVYGRAQQILLRRADGTCEPVTLKDEALAVSDLDAGPDRRPPEHQGYYRRSVAGPGIFRRYAAVRAATATVADALTKCVLLAEERSAAQTLQALSAQQVN